MATITSEDNHMDLLLSFVRSLPGAFGQGLAWGLMAIGVYLTYKILDLADLTVDGSLATGGAVCAVLISLGWNPWLALLTAVIAGMLAGLVTGLLHTACGIPAILAGILTQLALYSLNLRIMAIGDTAKTKATLALSVDRNPASYVISQSEIRCCCWRSSWRWSLGCCIGFSARSWAAPSVLPVLTSI